MDQSKMNRIAYLLDQAYKDILQGFTQDALGLVAEAKAIVENDNGSFSE